MDGDDDFYFLVLASIVVLVLAAYYILSPENSCVTLWVLINLIAGYLALTERGIRGRYVAILKGMKTPRYWGYALLMLFLVSFPFVLAFFLNPASPSQSGGSQGNPYLSNIVFILSLLPIVPLFAYAETQIFQRFILYLLLKKYSYRCPKCGGTAIGLYRCDLCGAPHRNDIPADARAISIGASAAIFALAHVLLVGSFLAGLTFVGGVLLADIYIKEGWYPVSVIHAIYDYIIIAIVLGGMLV